MKIDSLLLAEHNITFTHAHVVCLLHYKIMLKQNEDRPLYIPRYCTYARVLYQNTSLSDCFKQHIQVSCSGALTFL